MGRIKIVGLDKLQAKLEKSSKTSTRSLVGPLMLEAEQIMTEAKQNTPTAPDGGTLRASGHVQLPIVTPKRVVIIMGFGGAASAYALAVHEFPSKHDPPSWAGKTSLNWNVGGPQFLKNAVDRSQADLGRRRFANLHRWP